MALNSTGPISIGGSTSGQSINLEFGRSATQQTSMNQLYRGGSIVPNSASNAAIATSGQIDFNSFHGAANRAALSLTIASNVSNYDIYTQRPGGYSAGTTDLTVTINSGVVVSSTSTGSFALTTGTFTSGDTLTIINNGYIVGRGGQGGGGGTYGTGGASGGGGNSAGPAFQASYAVSIQNNGVIGGGGGGGGGGAAANWVYGYSAGTDYGGAGGGGGGYGSAGTGGQGGASAGSTYSGGGGGAGYGPSPNSAGGAAGGAGGALSASGSGGGNSYSYYNGQSTYGGGGGGGGACTSGNSLITWTTTGTRYGALN